MRLWSYSCVKPFPQISFLQELTSKLGCQCCGQLPFMQAAVAFSTSVSFNLQKQLSVWVVEFVRAGHPRCEMESTTQLCIHCGTLLRRKVLMLGQTWANQDSSSNQQLSWSEGPCGAHVRGATAVSQRQLVVKFPVTQPSRAGTRAPEFVQPVSAQEGNPRGYDGRSVGRIGGGHVTDFEWVRAQYC